MKLGKEGKEVELLVDTGATYSVLRKASVPVGSDYVVVKGATGRSERAYFCKALKYKYGKQWGIHKFLYAPISPESLLGRELFAKLQATIWFQTGEIILEVNDQRYVEVLSLMMTATESNKEISEEGISPIIENFLQLGLLKECQSDFNTPILPV